MDAESEKMCLEEIDHAVLDNDKKVTIAFISNNWNIPNKNSEVILEKWLKNYQGDRNIVKEYLIRGTDSNGNVIITIVAEKNLPKADEICPNHTRVLYSVEVGSTNGKSLKIQESAPNKYKCLKLHSEERNFKRNTNGTAHPIEKSIKKESESTKKSSNFFGTIASKSMQPKDVKPDKDVTKDVKVKDEITSPSKVKTSGQAKSPKQSGQAPAKTVKSQQGKSSIASFFASKPSTSTTTKAEISVLEATAKIEKVKIKDEPITVDSNGTKNTQKRPHSNASDSNEESKSNDKKQPMPSKKKMKLEPKRSRLLQICDSSSDEDDMSNAKDSVMEVEEEVVVKKEKENKTPSPVKSEKKNANISNDSKKRRVKVKKIVTRTYEDEDGFINTVRETEEVSCSEEEPEVTEPPPKKLTPNASNGSSANTKKKVSPPDGKKQGSILSFFGKK